MHPPHSRPGSGHQADNARPMSDGTPRDQGLDNLRWAHALLDGLAAAGVRRLVISPGSRSTPLVLAADRHPLLQTRVVLDERSAGFLALGQAKASGIPSALLATSGSAPTHWFPAVVEAASAHIPLLLLSADRPPELQDWGANQTLNQQALFGRHVRAFHQTGLPEADEALLRQTRQLAVKAVGQSLWPNPGPVHINIPLREPLAPRAAETQWPNGSGPAQPVDRPSLTPDPARLKDLIRLQAGGPGLLVCGPGPFNTDFARAVTQLAARLDCPLLADPLSGLRFGPWDQTHLISDYDTLLRRGAGKSLPAPAWILRFGAPPVSKALGDYLARQDCPQALAAPYGDWPDPQHRTRLLLRADPEALCLALAEQAVPPPAAGLLRAWRAAGEIRPAEPQGADARPFEGDVIRQLIQALPPHSLLFSANSQPIRQLDTWSGNADKPLQIHCNRGLSGIDGNLATPLGMASVSAEPVVGMLGDLSLLHDLGSLLAAPGLQAVILVFNNGGGGIFEHLPQAQLPGFERYWLTPQAVDPGPLCKALGVGHRRIERQSKFLPALQQALEAGNVQVLEIPIDRGESLRRHRAHWSIHPTIPGN